MLISLPIVDSIIPRVFLHMRFNVGCDCNCLDDSKCARPSGIGLFVLDDTKRTLAGSSCHALLYGGTSKGRYEIEFQV